VRALNLDLELDPCAAGKLAGKLDLKSDQQELRMRWPLDPRGIRPACIRPTSLVRVLPAPVIPNLLGRGSLLLYRGVQPLRRAAARAENRP